MSRVVQISACTAGGVHIRAMEVFPGKLAQIYGQGEAPMTITGLGRELHGDHTHPRFLERLASVGTARTGVEVDVVDGDGQPVALGEAGEVVVRGDVVMTGYLNQPEASASALRDGWLHTGDIGSMSPDGFVTLKDRSKDLIISGGSNVYPREVEEVLLSHPGLAEVSVVGAPDADWGEVVVAFVVARPGAKVTDGELDRLCIENIGRFKRPRHWLFVEVLPKNEYGKVLKTELREIARRNHGVRRTRA